MSGFDIGVVVTLALYGLTPIGGGVLPVAAASTSGITLPWLIGIVVTVGIWMAGHLAVAIWFASRVSTRLDHAEQQVQRLDDRMGTEVGKLDNRLASAVVEIRGLRTDLMEALNRYGERISRIEGKLNGSRR